MKTLFNILAGLLLLIGIIWAIVIIVAVATQKEGYTVFTDIIPALVFHLVSMLLGMLFIGLAQKAKKTATE